MNINEARHVIAEKNQEIKMLRSLKNDLLFYNRVVLCYECRSYDKGFCTHWQENMDREGYCSFGERYEKSKKD